MIQQGERIGRYTLAEPIGEGGFARVWLAHDDAGQERAIKVLHPDLLRPSTARGPSVADRFLEEAELLLRLASPGFVRVYEVIDQRSQGVVAMVMERLRGKDLGEARHALGAAQIISVFCRVADILSALHARDVVHRDLKLGNLFLCEETPPGSGQHAVKVLDLGVAKDLVLGHGGGNTATGMLVGTLDIMAPESLERADGDTTVSPAVDQWALGASLYTCLSGHPPFAGQTVWSLVEKIIAGPTPPLHLLARFGLSATPPELTAIVERCLAKRPEDRYPSMNALGRALRAVHVEVFGGQRTHLEPAREEEDDTIQSPEEIHLAELASLGIDEEPDPTALVDLTIDATAPTHLPDAQVIRLVKSALLDDPKERVRTEVDLGSHAPTPLPPGFPARAPAAEVEEPILEETTDALMPGEGPRLPPAPSSPSRVGLFLFGAVCVALGALLGWALRG